MYPRSRRLSRKSLSTEPVPVVRIPTRFILAGCCIAAVNAAGSEARMLTATVMNAAMLARANRRTT
jgi:hypothetical protein